MWYSGIRNEEMYMKYMILCGEELQGFYDSKQDAKERIFELSKVTTLDFTIQPISEEKYNRFISIEG